MAVALRSFQVTLPVPPRALHPNAGGHWGTRARATKQARHDAFWECKRLACWHGPPLERVRLTLFWDVTGSHPPDLDNLNASCKAYLDGIVDAGILVDDGARVVVRLEAAYCLHTAASGRPSTVQIGVWEVPDA